MTGIHRTESGQMGYQGEDTRKDNMKERFRMGISYISDGRHGDSLVIDMVVRDSLTLKDFGRKPLSRRVVLGYKQAEKRTKEALDEYSIKTSGRSDVKAPAELMSNDNQQRVIFPREMSGGAGLIVASQPTRGLNTRATRFVHEALLRQKDVGRYVLLISADLDGILGVSDRVAIICGGRTIGILSRERTDVYKINLLVGSIAKEATDE